MHTTTTTTLLHNDSLLFVIREGESIQRHPFWKFLNDEDRQYFGFSMKKNLLQGDFSRTLVFPSGRIALILGVCEKKKYNARRTILTARRAIVSARAERISHLTVALEDFASLRSIPEEVASRIATQFEVANFEFVAHRTAPKSGWGFVESISIFISSKNSSLIRAVAEGKIIGEEINKTRLLSNTPGGDMTPSHLAGAAVQVGKSCGIKVTVLKEKEIEELGMGGVLGVAKGSSEPPRFIVMEFSGGKKNESPTVLVGKGVTFDTGGLNLKPSNGIYEMHMDMSGGAATIHTIAAAARLKLKKNIVGLIPAVENMPSGSSYRPGDLLKSMSGKTIEVMNTDAEGRVILADALEYAKRYNPKIVIDIATLTGAAMVALGQRASAVFSNEENIHESLCEAGERAGDYAWPLPLWEEYEADVKGTFGDFANSGKSRYGGAIEGAVFLRQFIRNSDGSDAYPWAHLDIAPRMTSVEGEFLTKGAAGAPVALLLAFLRK
ncbi:MAG: leucyl aminopeptidase [Patescibacteria group bacterium]|nr:leucyl aminopeptidase [Patescibacteria group bacterium]